MIDSAIRCKNPLCGKPVTQLRGHRPREYCNDTCKEIAYRERKKQRVNNAAIVDDRSAAHSIEAEQRIGALEQELAAANEQIERLLGKKQSKQPVKRSEQERLTRVLEQKDWPAFTIHYRVNAGRKEGRIFVVNAPMVLLERALAQLEE